jgi:hypothetical protein
VTFGRWENLYIPTHSRDYPHDEAWNDFLSIKEEIIDASISLGQGNPTDALATGPLAKLLKTIQTDHTRQIRIFSEDSPEVTGVFFEMKK